jgi:hypothetical protein
MHSVAWHDSTHRIDAFVNDLWIFLVEEDPKAVNPARMSRDAPVAQVQAEQMNIGRPKILMPVSRLQAVWAGQGSTVLVS